MQKKKKKSFLWLFLGQKSVLWSSWEPGHMNSVTESAQVTEKR